VLSTRPSYPRLTATPSLSVMPYWRHVNVVPSRMASPVSLGISKAVRMLLPTGMVAITSQPVFTVVGKAVVKVRGAIGEDASIFVR